MKVSILGIKGLPAHYGGFETCVEETGKELVKKGMGVTVYCRKKLYKKRIENYNGIRLRYVTNINTKNLSTISATFFSALHVIFSSHKVVHLYTSGNSLFIPILKLFGKRCVISVDALDWKRKKWGRFASKYIKFSEKISVKFADSIISDSRTVCDYYKTHHKREIDYVPYGAKADYCDSSDVLKKYNLQAGKYFLFVGIFRPEKNVDFLNKSFNRAWTKDFKLVVIGDDPLEPGYVNYIHTLGSEKVIFPGRIYGEDYEAISSNAYCYVSASEVEGTSPALVAAMGFKTAVLVSDIAENRETIGNCGLTFEVNNEDDIIKKIEYLIDNPAKANELSEKAYSLVRRKYTWEKVSQDIYDIYRRITKRKRQL